MPVFAALVGLVALILGVGSPTEARITRVVITSTQSPTFGGYSWPGVGQYEKIVGKAYGEVDPSDAKNAVIVDIDLATQDPSQCPPQASDGKVQYAFDFYILKPIDLSKGAHKVMYEPLDRDGRAHVLRAVRRPGDGQGADLRRTLQHE